MTIDEKFLTLAAENAPGQELRQNTQSLDAIVRGAKLDGASVDFSHGDVNAFPPTPGSAGAWQNGYDMGGEQAYTEYRGSAGIRNVVSQRLARFTGHSINADAEMIITPGTQGALFLALGSVVTTNTKVAVVEPDYFANRKIVNFLGGEVIPIPLHYNGSKSENGPDLDIMERAFQSGVKVLVFSNPNNPVGLVYPKSAINAIATLAAKYGICVIVDQLYCRLLYSGESYTHLRASDNQFENLITIMGPSKTESLSGFRLGTAFGTAKLIDRMEQLQAIVSLRAPGYNQAVLNSWFDEPTGWMENRIAQHQEIRDDLLKIFHKAGFPTATSQAGSYLFPALPKLDIEPEVFVRILRHQAGVTVTPGSEFGSNSDNNIRLNFSQDHANAITAANRIVEMVARYQA